VPLRLTSATYRDVSTFAGDISHLNLRCDSRRTIADAKIAGANTTEHDTADPVEITSSAGEFAVLPVRISDYRRRG
jgi:hypothetical protein